MAFEHERGLFLQAVDGLSVRLESSSIWRQTCFPQILSESCTYDDATRRRMLWNWVRLTVPDRNVADLIAQTYWKIWTVPRLFTPVISPRKAATAAVQEHLQLMSRLAPVPVVSAVRWVPLETWYSEPLHPMWQARYDAASAELWTHSGDMPDLWRQMAFSHIQNVSEPRYGPAYKWLRVIWTQALWEAANGASGVWSSILRVAAWGYLPVGLALRGESFLVSSRSLP